MEYVYRFVRLASRYEEDTLGTTTIGFPGSSFTERPGDTSQLGSGIVFLEDAAGSREVVANTSRIEGWRRTGMYRTFQEVRHCYHEFNRGYLIAAWPTWLRVTGLQI